MIHKPFKINSKNYNRILFCSDTHFNHQPQTWSLAEKRGFTNIQDHDTWIIDQFKNTNKNDLILHFGDFSLNSTIEKTWEIIKSTPATIMYWWGNHESFISKIYLNALKNENGNDYYHVYPYSIHNTDNLYCGEKGFSKDAKIVFMGTETTLTVDRQLINCHHMAPLLFDKMKHGAWSICGHSHGSLAIANPDNTEHGKILDVGIDNAIKYNGSAFFTLDEVTNIMYSKKIKIYDHHGEDHV